MISENNNRVRTEFNTNYPFHFNKNFGIKDDTLKILQPHFKPSFSNKEIKLSLDDFISQGKNMKLTSLFDEKGSYKFLKDKFKALKEMNLTDEIISDQTSKSLSKKKDKDKSKDKSKSKKKTKNSNKDNNKNNEKKMTYQNTNYNIKLRKDNKKQKDTNENVIGKKNFELKNTNENFSKENIGLVEITYLIETPNIKETKSITINKKISKIQDKRDSGFTKSSIEKIIQEI